MVGGLGGWVGWVVGWGGLAWILLVYQRLCAMESGWAGCVGGVVVGGFGGCRGRMYGEFVVEFYMEQRGGSAELTRNLQDAIRQAIHID